MLYSVLADIYEKIEATTKRGEMTALLVELLKNSDIEVIDRVVYLTQGKLCPDYVGLELGIAEKLALRALSTASGFSIKALEDMLGRLGDIGIVAEEALSKGKATSILDFFGAEEAARQALTVERVYDTFMKIAKATGEGSQEFKISQLSALLKDAKPKEAKYIMRTITGKLRLGIADMTILDALAIAFGGGKTARPAIERAYNIHPDLGYIAKTLAKKGLDGIKNINITVGIPVQPMLAERLSNPAEILNKLGGSCLAEYKYDGERSRRTKTMTELCFSAADSKT